MSSRNQKYIEKLGERGFVRREFVMPLDLVRDLDALRERGNYASRSDALVAALKAIDLETVKPEAA